MSQIKVCPHCGSKMFVGAITRGCAVESIIDENGNPNFKLIKESSGDKYDLEILKCCRCKADINKDDLVEGVPCKECGKVVSPDELNEEGICEVCMAVKQRTELANASKEDLIMMLLDAEKKANSVIAKVEKQVKKAEKIETKQLTNNVSDDIDNTEDTKEDKSVTKKGGRRGKIKVGDDTKPDDNREDKTDDVKVEDKQEDVKEEEKVTDEEVAKAVDDIANQQDAPFPDLNDNGNSTKDVAPIPMNPPEPVQEVSVPQENTEGFKMFDDRDDEPF